MMVFGNFIVTLRNGLLLGRKKQDKLDEPFSSTRNRDKLNFIINVRVRGKDVKTLEELKMMLNEESLSDVIRTALRVLYYFTKVLYKGGEIIVRLPDNGDELILTNDAIAKETKKVAI